MKTGDIIAVGEGEAKPFRVVVDVLYGIQLEGDKALVAADKGFISCLLGGRGAGRRVFRNGRLLGGWMWGDGFSFGSGRGARVIVISAST